MRYWCNGSITAFQAVGEGSNPLYRSKNPFSLVNTQFKTVHKFLNYYFLLLNGGLCKPELHWLVPGRDEPELSIGNAAKDKSLNFSGVSARVIARNTQPSMRGWQTSLRRKFPYFGALAQLGEHLLCTQEVIGSSPICSTIRLGYVQ